MADFSEEFGEMTEKIESVKAGMQEKIDSLNKLVREALAALEVSEKPKRESSSGWIEVSENERMKASELRVALLLGKVPETAGLLIDAKVTADLLNISSRTLYRLDDLQAIPEPVRLGKLIRWRLAELLAWIDAGCPQRRAWVYPSVETKKRR